MPFSFLSDFNHIIHFNDARINRMSPKNRHLILKFIMVPMLFGFTNIATAQDLPNNDEQQITIADTLKKLTAQRIANGKIKIDGILNEDTWASAATSQGFVQNEPDEGKPATQKTTIQVAYDDHSIYIAMIAHEPDPTQITSFLTRRDSESPCDWLGVIIDSYNDKRTAFGFAVNPSGVKMDGQMDNSGNLDSNWDAVWHVKTKIDEQGWIAEFEIPLSQLRFPKKDIQTWGFQAVRIKNKTHETDFWQFIPKDAGSFVSRFGQLNGLKNLPQPRRLQMLPYIVSSGNFYPREQGNPFRAGPFADYRMGGDIKYGLSSNITLDMTINPDFGQVEADPSEVNLTAYETFFEEKRPFFIEGSQIYNYGIGVGDGDMGQETLFYSRRIGRRPHHEPDISDDGFLDQPQFSSIWGAAKISGKTKHGWSIGMLEAVTGEMKADVKDYGQRYEEIVEPWTNYFLVRTQKDYQDGRTTIGGIVTNVLRDIPTDELNWLNSSATAGGIDFSHRTKSDNYMIQASFLGSYIKGSREAIDEAQISSARYFQRPDADHLSYDPTRTSLAGFGGSWFAGKIAGGHWRYGTGGITRSPGFEVNDMGYMRSADQTIAFIYGAYQEFKPGKVFRDYNLNSSTYTVYNYGMDRILSGINVNLRFRFLNYWGIFGGINSETEGLDTDFLRGGPAVIVPGRLMSWFGGFSDYRESVSFRLFGNYSTDFHGSPSFQFEPEVTLRPSGRFNMSFSLGYNPGTSDRQYIDEIWGNGQAHYVFAKLKMKILYLTSRFNYSFTPDLSIQFYGMPFIAAAKYSDYREVINPRAKKYEDRFQSYPWDDNDDFNFKEFRSNFVIRWEYRPGSTIFFVWAHNQSDFLEEDGSFDLHRDLRRLLKIESENIFLVKVNRWFDF